MTNQCSCDSQPARVESTRSGDDVRVRQVRAVTLSSYALLGYEIDEEVMDEIRQRQGIDVICHRYGHPESVINVDEKGAFSVKYFENPARTFVLELHFLNTKTNRWQTGWLASDLSKTDYYLFHVPHGKTHNGKIVQIYSIRHILIPKQVILDFISKYGYTLEEIVQLMFNLYPTPVFGQESKVGIWLKPKSFGEPPAYSTQRPFGDALYVLWSRQLNEKPINILLPLDVLESLSVAHVTREFTEEQSDAWLAWSEDPRVVALSNKHLHAMPNEAIAC